jgi:eukaryotic-like serine/threonine-protein kinase
LRKREGRFEAGPEEDVYALGVTAYRLVTGRYPPEVEVEKTEEGYRVLPRVPVEFEPGERVSPELAALIRRMLSEEPSARGSAAEMAKALEGIARGQRQDETPVLGSSSGAFEERGARNAVSWRARRWAPWGVALVVVALMFTVEWTQGIQQEEAAEPGSRQAKVPEEEDAGTVGLADAVLQAPTQSTASESAKDGVGLDIPQQPFPGQLQPPCGKALVVVNGGCWVHAANVTPPCGANAFEWKKGCYVPMYPPPRPQTSHPQ